MRQRNQVYPHCRVIHLFRLARFAKLVLILSLSTPLVSQSENPTPNLMSGTQIDRGDSTKRCSDTFVNTPNFPSPARASIDRILYSYPSVRSKLQFYVEEDLWDEARREQKQFLFQLRAALKLYGLSTQIVPMRSESSTHDALLISAQALQSINLETGSIPLKIVSYYQIYPLNTGLPDVLIDPLNLISDPAKAAYLPQENRIIIEADDFMRQTLSPSFVHEWTHFEWLQNGASESNQRVFVYDYNSAQSNASPIRHYTNGFYLNELLAYTKQLQVEWTNNLEDDDFHFIARDLNHSIFVVERLMNLNQRIISAVQLARPIIKNSLPAVLEQLEKGSVNSILRWDELEYDPKKSSVRVHLSNGQYTVVGLPNYRTQNPGRVTAPRWQDAFRNIIGLKRVQSVASIEFVAETDLRLARLLANSHTTTHKLEALRESIVQIYRETATIENGALTLLTRPDFLRSVSAQSKIKFKIEKLLQELSLLESWLEAL